ncbi:hypothetical protein MPMin1_gp75 [Microbacterium phage Min1]|uniref:Uncharacterized protein n=1 Tax=Microbacterium phage Min1 TaxID=446529 RepID=A6N233_9CAUD|nr:hypothetical protein MPMin1_gp75 [Microbacterium phage Min1]ABR10505.1 hypothetical protein [Microbacterium phage Min1]
MTDLSSPEYGAATCASCGVVLRDDEGGLRCPSCGTIILAPVVVQPVFDGPDIDDWR